MNKPEHHKLTPLQRTRAALRVAGVTVKDMAEQEGVSQRAVLQSLWRATDHYHHLLDLRDQAAIIIGVTRQCAGKPLEIKQLLDRVVEQAQQGLTARPRGRPAGSKNRRPRRRPAAGQWGPKPAPGRATDSAREGTQACFDDNCGDNDSD